jgi:hypothetical protein
VWNAYVERISPIERILRSDVGQGVVVVAVSLPYCHFACASCRLFDVVFGDDVG